MNNSQVQFDFAVIRRADDKYLEEASNTRIVNLGSVVVLSDHKATVSNREQ